MGDPQTELSQITVAETAQSNAPASARVAASPVLLAKLAALRRRRFAIEVGTGVALAVILCVELLALLMFADWWFDFPWGLRLVLFLIQFGIFNVLLYRYVFRPQFRPPDDDELALQVEHAHPELQSRLISSVQFSRPGALSPWASAALAASTIEQTEAATATLDFTRVVPTGPLKKLSAAAITVLLMASLGFVASRAVSFDLLRRAFLADVAVPRKTRIDWVTGEITVGRGDVVRLEALANGVIPALGTLQLESAGRREQEFQMDRVPEQHGRFLRALENVQEDFQYRVRLNDSLSPLYTVHVVPRPTINQLECEQIPPAYTELKPAKRSLGDLSLLAGSTLRFTAKATKDLRSANVRLLGLDQRQTLNVNRETPRDLAGEVTIPTKGLTGLAFELIDTQEMKSSEGTVYRIDILPDRPPQTKLTWPERKEELITRLATMVVGFDVSDDFSITQVALKYKVNTVENGAEKSLELGLESGSTNRVRRRYEWKIGAIQPPLAEGSLIEFWIEARDNNNVTGPGIGTSEHQIARVVTENEKRADLLNRAGDSIGALGDITTDQEKLNRNLGTLILEKTGAR